MVPKAKLSAEDQPDEVDPAIHRRYRSIVGALGWLSNGTRPDISHAYSELSKYCTIPRNGNQPNGNHLEICLSSPVENRNSLAWVLPTNQASFVYSRGITYTDISDRKS